jgi:hypothetical protein
MLRASCIARSLERRGGKRTLVQRLTASLVEQKNAGMLHRRMVCIVFVAQIVLYQSRIP